MEASKNYPDSLPESPIWRESMDWPDTDLIQNQARKDLAWLREECWGFDDCRRLASDESKQQMEEWQKKFDKSIKKLLDKCLEIADSNWVCIDLTPTTEINKKLHLPENELEKIEKLSF